MTAPILYSFRRCPYAMRARLAIQVSQQSFQIREVVLRDKPTTLIEASAKGTVPVVVLSLDHVIDESLDIMQWALRKNDPLGWLIPDTGTLPDMVTLIDRTETEFKRHLDRYKYASRYEGAVAAEHRAQASIFLRELNERLVNTPWLFGNRASLADAGIAPFVRQFANTDRQWFNCQSWTALRGWLEDFLASPLLAAVMEKLPQWAPDDAPRMFPTSDETIWERRPSQSGERVLGDL